MMTPLGVAVPMLYTIPLFLTWARPGERSSTLMGGSAIFLTLVGVAFSPGEVSEVVIVERVMASTLHFVVTWLLIVQKRSTRKVKAAQQAMHESEERLRLFIEHAPVALAMFDRDMRYLAVSCRWITDYGLNDRDVIGQSHYDIFPEIPERWKAVHQRGLGGEIVREEEDRFKRPDASERWLCWEVRPWKTAEERVGGIVIFTEDITERKKVERELRNHQAQLEDLTAKLLTSQEEERKRIARDLHDDFTQQLAALTIDLQRQARLASESGIPPASHLVQMGKKTEQLTTDLQRMAHRLHSSLLEQVGLEAAFRECVDEFSTRAELTTELVMRELPRGISLEQATCLYRVLQESLQNVTKHANAANILVRLQPTRNGLELCIQDDGLGFDQSEKAAHSNGLGLTSMAERIKGLQGTFRIESTLGFGTEIHVWIPISEVESDR
ncbi:MAG: PAS domain-containing sensor histidine kinase [Nitrospira sp.]|nr:PAS domain-containing sensor histidine kinase [Nitrospira sp.]